MKPLIDNTCTKPGRPIIDISGQRFGRLVAKSIDHKGAHGYHWLCICDCGNKHIVNGYRLRSGKCKSCGCLWRSAGGSTGGLNAVWKAMKRRCNAPENKDYQYYGAKGITVCDEWSSFRPFEKWANENGYKTGMSIDRIDNRKGYSPSNCQWISFMENCKKQSNYTARRKRK